MCSEIATKLLNIWKGFLVVVEIFLRKFDREKNPTTAEFRLLLLMQLEPAKILSLKSTQWREEKEEIKQLTNCNH